MYIYDNKQNITKYKPNQLKHEQINKRCLFLCYFVYRVFTEETALFLKWKRPLLNNDGN